jgi:hypothetical protein
MAPSNKDHCISGRTSRSALCSGKLIAATQKSVHARWGSFWRQEVLISNLYLLTVFGMLPTVPKLLLMTVFAMPFVVAVVAMIGAWADRRSGY